jgi:predicted alpha/beta-hydrolase family hydrolase
VTILLLAAVSASAEEIVTVSGRKGETQSYLLMHNSGPPKAVAVMFPGGEGLLRLHTESGSVKFWQGSNFLVRTRGMFRDDEVAVAIVDAPSDQQRAGMDDGFRTGRAHVEDIVAVVSDLRKRFPGAKLFLVGTSRGTLSAAYAGRSLGDAVDGVVLTSSVFYPGGRGIGLYGFDFGAIRAPLLFVHNVHDACRGCPYGPAESLGRRFQLISVSGGKPAQSDPCEPLAAHGYFGREEETVKAIKNWMLGRPFPRTVS